MAGRSLKTRDEDDDIIDVTPDDIDGDIDINRTQDLKDQKAIEDEIRNELGGPADNEVRYKVVVHRVPSNGGKMIWLFDRPGESVAGLKEELAEKYKTGTYVARVYKITPKEGARQKEYHTIRVEVPIAALAPTPAPASDSALAMAVRQQGETQAALIAQIAALKTTPAPALDLEKMLALATAAVGLFKQLAPPPPPPPQDPMKMVGMIMEAAREFGGQGGEPRHTSFLDIIGKFAESPLFTAAVESAMQPPAQSPQLPNQPAPQRPQIAGQPAQPAAPQPQQPSATQSSFATQIAMLLKAAEKDSDPTAYAVIIADQLDPALLQTILAQPDPVASLAQYNPAIATYRPWFLELIEALTNPDEGIEDQGALHSISTPVNATGVALTPASPAASADGSAFGSGGGEANSQADEPAY